MNSIITYLKSFLASSLKYSLIYSFLVIVAFFYSSGHSGNASFKLNIKGMTWTIGALQVRLKIVRLMVIVEIDLFWVGENISNF